jgi:cytochrome c peroxidase
MLARQIQQDGLKVGSPGYVPAGVFRALRRHLGPRLLGCCVVFLLISPDDGFGAAAGLPNARSDYSRPADIPFPEDNPYSAPKAALGRELFFDKRLSGDGSLACASCHRPDLAWGDGRARAVGWAGSVLLLRSPTLLNLAWISILGWDGKFADLESVAFAPLLSPGNMHQTEPELVARLGAVPAYQEAFRAAFGTPKITRRAIEQALATYERTIVSGEAPFDRWVAGDEQAISATAKRGFELFNGRANCAACHTGWNFTEGAFYDIGLPGNAIGRGQAFPNSVKLRGAFKVPTLRDVAGRAPYMHDGSLPDLDAVIDFYDAGGQARPSRSDLIRPLGLSQAQKAELRAFLETLTEDENGTGRSQLAQP